jgi:hypothetical protein
MFREILACSITESMPRTGSPFSLVTRPIDPGTLTVLREEIVPFLHPRARKFAGIDRNLAAD